MISPSNRVAMREKNRFLYFLLLLYFILIVQILNIWLRISAVLDSLEYLNNLRQASMSVLIFTNSAHFISACTCSLIICLVTVPREEEETGGHLFFQLLLFFNFQHITELGKLIWDASIQSTYLSISLFLFMISRPMNRGGCIFCEKWRCGKRLKFPVFGNAFNANLNCISRARKQQVSKSNIHGY